MARTIPKMKKSTEMDYLILRSALYGQRLPHYLIVKGAEVADRITILVKLEYITILHQETKLTRLGRKYLYRLSGEKKPPMIDHLDWALLTKDEKCIAIDIKKPTVKEILQSASLEGSS